MTRKLEGGISIVDWGGTTPTPIVSDVRGVLEANDVAGILVDMRDCKELLADHLEALTEANRVCQDRNCRIGLFGVNDRLARLVEVSGLREEIPDLLNGDENQVVAAFRNGKQVTTASPELEFEIDLGGPTEEAMNAPTARFASATVAGSEPYSAVDARDDATQVYGAPPQLGQPQADEELLAVYWADLTSTGYVIGGDSADEIMNAVTTGSAPRSQPIEAPEEGVIDLGEDLDATQQFKTTLMPTFDLGEGSGDDWTATPTGAVEVDFGGASGLAPAGPGVFAGPGESDFSPVDTSGGAPPPGVLQARAQQQVPTELPQDSDETVMFQPGALDEALRQAGMAAAAAAPPPIEDLDTAPTGHVMVPPEPPAYGADDSDETVMFQPGSLDMALLAEVAAAAGPEQAIAAPAVEAPPAPAGRPAGRSLPDGFEVEVRLFMHDFAITSNLHLQVLDRFVKADTEILGRTDLQVATGGTRAQVIEIVDQFVQSRLVRRMRSPRIRGGSGFVFSPSPATRNTVTRLLKMWQNPQDRQKVSGWLRGTM